MNKMLRVLHVEDDENDSELMIRHLRGFGFDVIFRRVETAQQMSNALREERWDVLLSDFSLPHFSAPAALDVLNRSGLDIPFIIVSGTVAAERAVPAMQSGARDFIVKTDFERLVPAIERELKEAASRSARREAERELRESNELFRLLVEGVTDYAIMMLDPEGRVVSWNPGGERLSGYGQSEVVGKSFSIVFTPEDVRDGVPAREMSEAIATGRAADDRWHVRKDGSRWFASGVLSPLWNDDGTLRGFSKILRDITERKRVEDQLKRRTEELLRSNTELEQYAYAASHDLQEPLRMIMSYLQLLQRKQQRRLDEEANVYIGFVVDGAKRMHLLINDILNMARLGGELRSQSSDLREVVTEVIQGQRGLIEESAAVVTTDDLPVLLVDRSQMTELFRNLIGNGLKFRGPSPPEIRIGAVRRQRDWLFSVRDNGIGIDAEYHAKIFVIFQRLHADREKYPGTGMGLAICRKIVERHGGRIWVESEPEKGSVFHFTIPHAAGETDNVAELTGH